MDNEETIRERKYETIYRSYANDIYKVCLFYLRDENKAMDVTVQVFLNFYERFEDVDDNYHFAYLVREAKYLINSDNNGGYSAEEVRV